MAQALSRSETYFTQSVYLILATNVDLGGKPINRSSKEIGSDLTRLLVSVSVYKIAFKI